jgi:two-component system, OmpR family, alkaline phosphatase synthesis response regulator PhoP
MKPRVLLVDDEPDFRELLAYNLTRQDFEVFTAANGIEALNQARRWLPNVILLDLMLPDLDGFSVCELLHAQPSTANAVVIVVSALGGQSIQARSLETGVAGFLKKPVDLGSLGNRIRAACERQEEQLRARMTEDA